MVGPNPAFTGTPTIRALTPEETAAAKLQDSSGKRAALDEAELQELEHAEYYGETPATTLPPVTAPRRSLLARLFRR